MNLVLARMISQDRHEDTHSSQQVLLTKPAVEHLPQSLTDHREKKHFASMYIYIHIEKPTNYTQVHLYLYLYICGIRREGYNSNPHPGLEN